MTDTNRKQGLLKATFSLWVNWAYTLVAFTVITLITPHIGKGWVPLVLYLFSVIIMIIIRRSRKWDSQPCNKIPYTGALTLMWTGCVFILFNIISFLDIKTDANGQPYNPEMPWLIILVLAPVGIAVCRYFMSEKKRAFCVDCEARYGLYHERGFLARLYSKEAKFQTRCLYYICVGLTIVEWLYFFMFFKNVSLNNSDMYFFTFVPTAIFALSLIYMGFRYHGYYIYYLTSDLRANNEPVEKTIVRYLLVAENTLCIKLPAIDGEQDLMNMSLADTPVSITMAYTDYFNHIEAENTFREVTGIRGAEVRFLYKSADNNSLSNIFHYVAYLKSPEDIQDSKITGEWLDFPKIMMLHKTRLLSNRLEAELHRIHTTVMAWKTYTPKGKRKYEIKHYQPTFRLCDMKKWDVDYNNPLWLFISMNNEDKPFFRFRRLWRKLITGTGI